MAKKGGKAYGSSEAERQRGWGYFWIGSRMAVQYACPICFSEFKRWSACSMHFTTSTCKEAVCAYLDEPELQKQCRVAVQGYPLLPLTGFSTVVPSSRSHS